MKNLFNIFVLCFVSIVMTACYSVKLPNYELIFTPIPESNKKLDIPIYNEKHNFSGYPYVYWHFTKQKQKQLGIESPETSKDSLIFRLWITNPAGATNQPHALLEIKKDSVDWRGILVLMRVNFKISDMSETITSSKLIELKPLKSNWESIVDSLMKLKVDELPTDDLIPGYYVNNSGYGTNSPTYSFEYATKDEYRFYHYNNIYRVPDKFWQPRNVISILELLDEEFEWDAQARKHFLKR